MGAALARFRKIVLRFDPGRMHLVEWIARAGYAARGFVYILLGALSLMAAVELREDTAGTYEALVAFGEWPLGSVWLLALGLGLTGFMLWRLVQAVLDPDRQGTSPGALTHRFGQGVSGLLYGSLAYSAFELNDALEVLLPRDSNHGMVKEYLASSWGDEILLGLGLCVLIAALGNAAKAFSSSFDEGLRCGAEVKSWVLPMGRAGYLARGVAFALLCILAFEAAFDLRAAGVESIGEALQSLERKPFGSALLAVTAIGLSAFGAFGFVEAWYRRIPVPKEFQSAAPG